MSQPSFLGLGAGSETSCAWPAGHQAGDWGILAVQHGGGTVATPTGCAIVDGSPFTYGTELISLFQIKAASGSESALALSGGTDHMWGRLAVIRNAHGTYPIHALAVMDTGAATTAGAAPGLKILIDDVLVLDIVAWSADNAGPMGSAPTNAGMTGITEQGDDGTITGNGGGLYFDSGTSAGNTTLTFTTITFTSSRLCGVKIAFAPICDHTVTGTVTINGSAAPNGGTVRILDVTQPAATYLCPDATIAGGAGGYTANVPYNDHNYVAVFGNGTNYGASASALSET